MSGSAAAHPGRQIASPCDTVIPCGLPKMPLRCCDGGLMADGDTMRRRDFIAALGGAAALGPLAPLAQQDDRVRRIGVLQPAAADDPVFQARLAAFRRELALLGWDMGRNVRIEARWATTNAAEIRRQAAELAALGADVILAAGDSTVPPLLEATRTVPIVFTVVS